MNVESRIFDGTLAAQYPALEIDDHEIAGPHLRPMQAEGRQQKSIRIARHQQCQMVVDALVEPKVRRQPVTRRKIDARLTLGVARCRDRLEFGIHDVALRTYGCVPV
jgi:hypothetical protein